MKLPQPFQRPFIPSASPGRRDYSTPEDYLTLLSANDRAEFTEEQLDRIRMLLASAIPQPSPKLVDLRFDIDLLMSRFYIVLFVGKDRRQKRRSHLPPFLTHIGNLAVATALLLSINILISICLFILLYLVKSALNIDIIPGAHLAEHLQRFQ